MFEYAAPNIVYRLGSWRGYPFQATREGKQACMEMAHAINIAYENLGSVLHHLLIDGQDVALCRTVTVRNRGSGAAVSYEVWNYARFEDGLVVEFSEFPDTEATALLDLPL